MKEVILLLHEQGVDFKVEGNRVLLGSTCTGMYGYTDTEILYNYYGDGRYTVRHGFRGYPYQESFDDYRDAVKSACGK